MHRHVPAALAGVFAAAALGCAPGGGVERAPLEPPPGGRLDAYGAVGRPVYWRRLQPISDVAHSRDNIWMEQVNVRDGRVVWGMVQPRGNVVVAAAEVEGVCG
jgi:hypothetical protein